MTRNELKSTMGLRELNYYARSILKVRKVEDGTKIKALAMEDSILNKLKVFAMVDNIQLTWRRRTT